MAHVRRLVQSGRATAPRLSSACLPACLPDVFLRVLCCSFRGNLFVWTRSLCAGLLCVMFLLDSDSQLDCLSHLLEAGDAVSSTEDPTGQSPAHVAAWGGQASWLLWLLQTGADANRQDSYGETPVHKAAKAGSLECISVLVASEARLEICNNEGKTAEELAWACGFAECARLLETLRCIRSCGSPAVDEAPRHGGEPFRCTLAGQKRPSSNPGTQDGKRRREW